MSRAPDHATFVASLRREVSAYAEFLDLLQREQACLVRSEIDALTGISRQKSDKVEELGSLARLRCAFLESHALSPNAQGMRQWVGAQSGTEADELSSLWDNLSKSAAEAQRINQLNGTLINNRLAYNREALTAFSGITRPMGVYGPDGSTAVRVSQRDFGAA